MEALHENSRPAQPDRDIRLAHLEEMLAYFTDAEQRSLQRCANALREMFDTREALSNKCVLVAYSGGKDSSYVVAYVRLVQLWLFRETGDTFRIRIFTYRHPGVPQGAMENIHRVYSALGLYSDPTAEMLLFDEEDVSLFDRNKPAPSFARQKNRRDVLMVGHLTQGEGRPIFCNACNISYVRSLVSAATLGISPVHVFVTGDSTREMKDYCKWVRRLAEHIIDNPMRLETGFRGFRGYQAVQEIAECYYKEIYGDNYENSKQCEAWQQIEDGSEPQFFSIYDYTDYAPKSHWLFLTEYLGFRFDDLAFSFTESDCTNPAVMAHIRGIKAEHVHQRNYENGILDYLQLALQIMKEKNIPESLILEVLSRYLGYPGMQAMRNKIQQFTEGAYGISETQLVCMVYSPFCNQGRELKQFLTREHADLSCRLGDIHYLLSGYEVGCVQHGVAERLSEISGLDLRDLHTLYRSQFALGSPEASIIKRVLIDDPHKLLIETRHSTHGPIVREVISGR